jgi:DNA-binding transcriptional LysR family regulator
MLKVNLFDRVGREIILTPHGERLYDWAIKILKLKDEALLDLTQGMTEFKGAIRLAASSVPGQFIIPRMVRKFREEYPNVTFHINQSSSKDVSEKVLNGLVDFGILGEKYENEKLHYIPLLKEKLVLVTPSHFEITSPVNIHDLLEHPFVMRNSDSGTNAILERFLKKKHITKEKLNIIAYTDSIQSLIQFVLQGIGMSIISEIAAKEYASSNQIKLHEIEDFEDERYFYLVYNKNKTLSLVSKLFINDAAKLV